MREGITLLRERGIPCPEKEMEQIIVTATGADRVELLRDDPDLTSGQLKAVDDFLERRMKGEPLQYITGHVEFFGLSIRVGPGVLIPRPETELLVEETLKAAGGEELSILDLCTGSGCIALALAQKLPDAEVCGTDGSAQALEYARENAAVNSIRNVTFLRGDLFEPVRGRRFHIIVSNPPYIRSADIATLQEEVSQWEPREALDGGPDGLDYYRRIVAEAAEYLEKRGKCFLEMGHDQREALSALAQRHGFRASFRKDLAGLDRIAILSLE